jgi:hypothetical protein
MRSDIQIIILDVEGTVFEMEGPGDRHTPNSPARRASNGIVTFAHFSCQSHEALKPRMSKFQCLGTLFAELIGSNIAYSWPM